MRQGLRALGVFWGLRRHVREGLFRPRRLYVLLAVLAFALLAPTGGPPPAPSQAAAGTLPSGFQESVVFSGLTNPTVVRFASDGRVFVAEKSGLIKVFDSLTDPSPTVFADLRTNVFNYWDRGLLGMALDPNFPSTPYVYVLYSYDHVLGDPAPPPRWGVAGATSDDCPTPPGPTTDGCVTSGRLSRLQASGNVMTGSEQVLIENWCNQFQTHSVGTVEFGPDGALYASGGEGANADVVDYGQLGNPRNPCGDPPGGVGGSMTPPTAEGGALRSQDLRTPSDPVTLDGTIIRVDPATGAGLPTNPFAGNSDPNARRVIAYGLRNPFRFTFRPGAGELWLGDVGWGEWEEINRITSPTDSTAENFGWPCYEGAPRQSGYDSANLNICENLYASSGAVTGPFFAYRHSNKVVTGESCPTGTSSISGLSFEFSPSGSTYPAAYQRALFFADYSRNCIWVMKKDANGIPAPGLIETFDAGASGPVNLEFGPGGDLYYADFNQGTIRRISYTQSPTPPPSGTNYLSDLEWTSMTNGWGPVEKDTSNGEDVGGDGNTLTLNGVTYSKGLGAHAVSDVRYDVAGACSTFKAQVGVDDEVPGTNGSIVFQVYAGATKVYDSGVMNASTATKTVDVSIAGANELRLVVTDGGDDFFYDHADWALARVECGNDTSPPTITGKSPTDGANGVALDVNTTATFSEPMDPSTLTTATFTLVRQGQSTPLPAAVSYAGQTATLNPTASLEPSTSYTATVKGGAGGAKDVAGNALASDVNWTFQTAAGANNPPTPVIDAPASTRTWKVGDQISFSGHATDPEQGQLPASALTWTLLIQHCPSNCHTHTVQSWPGIASGTFSAPDHEYPSHLDLELTAIDANGASATTTVSLDPMTAQLTVQSSPSGLQLAVNGTSSATPFTRTVIVGSANTVSATTPQTLGGTTYEFSSWSDSGAQTHVIVAPAGQATFTAAYVLSPPRNTGLPVLSGQANVGRTLSVSDGTWSGSLPMGFTYQWQRCEKNGRNCVNIAGATASTYTATQADNGLRVRAVVTASNAGGTASAESEVTKPIR